MAISAIQAQTAHVVRMAERDRLFPRLHGPRGVIRPVQLGDHPRQETQNEDRAENDDPRKSVRTVMKDLRHLVIRLHLTDADSASPLQQILINWRQ
jgi:hypothetical protein